MNPLYLTKKQTTLLFLVALGLACFGLLPSMQAVVPAPDGGYPGGNTAEGQAALLSLTTGGFNTAVGFFSLRSNTTGRFNTATGAGTLLANTGAENTATGAGALLLNTTGDANTANGDFALLNNTTGTNNTAIGGDALFSNTTGGSNTAVGVDALISSTGSGNIALGAGAGGSVTTANNVICIGETPGANVSNSCFIGNIYGVNEGGTISAVYINSIGQLGTQPPPSSVRFKKEIKPMDKASEAILALKPVTFHYKSDKTNRPEFGLIAEEVATVNPDLVVRDANGEIYTVRYDAVNAMLLNEFLKEHRKVQELEANAARQQEQIQALTMGLRKVSAQLAVTNAPPRVVFNDR